MKITVTQEDIMRGLRINSEQCPVALAMNREIGQVYGSGYYVCVYGTHANLYRVFTMLRRIDFPEVVLNFVHDFDDGFNVAPFSFSLPDPYLTLAA